MHSFTYTFSRLICQHKDSQPKSGWEGPFCPHFILIIDDHIHKRRRHHPQRHPKRQLQSCRIHLLSDIPHTQRSLISTIGPQIQDKIEHHTRRTIANRAVAMPNPLIDVGLQPTQKSSSLTAMMTTRFR